MKYLLATLAAVVMFTSAPALGQWIPREDGVKRLMEVYKEEPRSIGLTSNGFVLEVFRTENGSTWTIIVTKPDGLTAPIASGLNWQDLPSKQGVEH